MSLFSKMIKARISLNNLNDMRSENNISNQKPSSIRKTKFIMQRPLILFLTIFVHCLNMSGQGQVLFSNDENSTVSLADTGELLGQGWKTQLWAGKTDSELKPVGEPIEFLAIGRFVGPSVTIDGIWGGETGIFKVAAWKAPAESIEEAQSSGLPWGFSNTFSQALGGQQAPGQGLPLVPARLTGLEAFAIQESQLPVIGNWVWLDANGNGLQDVDEIGIEGVTLKFIDCESGAFLLNVESDASGYYAFPGSLPEAVYIKVVVPEGFRISPWLVGDNTEKDSNLDPLTAATQCIAVDCDSLEDALCPGTHIDIGLIPAHPLIDPVGDNEPALAERGVSEPGFWKRHQGVWPIEVITVGSRDYTKEEARRLISNGSDKSLTMFRQVLTAKLNIAAGSQADCIEDILTEADQWLKTHGPVPSRISPSSIAWRQGKSLAEYLNDYNTGNACAPKQDESLSPVELKVGFQGQGNAGKQLRLRIQGEPGRIFVLQRTLDFETWEDIALIENAFGINEIMADASAEHPTGIFRVIPQQGPARKRPAKVNLKGVFKQLDQRESVTLAPIVYEGDLVVKGNSNHVSGETINADKYTVIAGNLDIRGNKNIISNLTVLGDVILRGNTNELSNVDYQGQVIQKGNANNLY
jgi:hypothetical protein